MDGLGSNSALSASASATNDRYPFGSPNDLGNYSEELNSARILLHRLKQQQGPKRRSTVGSYDSLLSKQTVSVDTNAGCETPTGSIASVQLYLSASERPSVESTVVLREAAEQLRRCLHAGDVQLFQRILTTHRQQFPIMDNASPPLAMFRESKTCASRLNSTASNQTITDFARSRLKVRGVSNQSETSHYHLPCIFHNCIHLAILHQQKEMVELLLKCGVDPDVKGACECPQPRTKQQVWMPSTSNAADPHNSPHASNKNFISRGSCCSSCTCESISSMSVVDVLPLFLAVQVKNVDIVLLLCKHGARTNFADVQGNTALIEAVKESPICWDVVEVLLQYGAKIHTKNVHNICALDLVPELARFQQFCLEELVQSASGIPRGNSPRHSTISSLLHAPSFFSRSNASNFDEKRPSVSHYHQEESSGKSNVFSSRKSLPFLHRKFRNLRDELGFGEIGIEQSFGALILMVQNPECLTVTLAALLKHVNSMVATENHKNETCVLDQFLGKLLSQMLITAINEFDNGVGGPKEKKDAIVSVLCPIVKYSVQILIKGGRCLQFTALCILNKVLDTGTCLDLFNVKTPDFQSNLLLVEKIPVLKLEHQMISHVDENTVTPPDSPTVAKVPVQPIPWMAQQSADATTIQWDLFTVFQSIEPTTVITVLYNALTMQKRVVGAKCLCTPSHRWRQCNHCLQILSSRLLLFLCHIYSFRKAVSTGQNIRILVDMLDATHDPQLLCLVLQAISLISMNPKSHATLKELQIDDSLIQMLLPGDEWYYTNHTTLFPQFVKHHAARILIYIGLGDRVGNRVNLFHFPGVDQESTEKQDKKQKRLQLKEGFSAEDQYICDTCITPLMATNAVSKEMFSVEGCLVKILTEVSQCCVSNKEKEWKMLEARFAGIASIIDPIILVRVLLHKLSWDLGLVTKVKVQRKSLFPTNFQKSKSFDRRATSTDGQGAQQKRVRIRRSSSLQKFDQKIGDGETVDKRHDSTGSRRALGHLPKYIQNFFRAKNKKNKFSEGSMSVNSSDSEAVAEFQKQLQNLPKRKKGAPGSESTANLPRSHTLEESPRSVRRSIDSEKSSNRSNSKEGQTLIQNGAAKGELPLGSPKPFPQIQIEIRRASEIRRDSQYSQYSYGYSLGSPDSDYMPLLTPPPTGSRKSSGSSNVSGRSSYGHFGFNPSPVPSIASDGPYTFTFVARRRASTIVGTLPRIQTIHATPQSTMSPEISALRMMLISLVQTFAKSDEHLNSVLKETGDVLHQVLNNSQDQKIKEWCSSVVQVIAARDLSDEIEEENDDKLTAEYFEFQEKVLTGVLPCSRDEAAILASIELSVEEQWPGNKRRYTIHRQILRGQFGKVKELTQKIMVTPWEVDPSVYTPVTRQHYTSVSSNEPSSSAALRRKRRLFSSCILAQSDVVINQELLAQCLPPDYKESRRAVRLIKDHKRKLFHTSFYDSEKSMKRLYVQTCKRLPAYGCKIFPVKELLHGKTMKKTTRLLCLSSASVNLLDASTKLLIRSQPTNGLQQWRVGGGTSKHLVVFEFKAVRWQLAAPSYVILKAISTALWEIMQINTPKMLQRNLTGLPKSVTTESLLASQGIKSPEVATGGAPTTAVTCAPSGSLTSAGGATVLSPEEPITLYKLELERLQYIFHFPEEVAFQLSTTEYELFYSIPPLDYVHYVTCDLSSTPLHENPSNVRILVKRFAEVSSWITHLIISQPTHDDRKNILSCILRVVETCWNIGNFNAAVEILTGLKSEKLKPFWLSLHDDDKIQFNSMSDILLSPNPSPQLMSAVQRALTIPQTRVIPFFGTFLKDLYTTFQNVPMLVVIGNQGDRAKLEVKTNGTYDFVCTDTPVTLSSCFQFISDFNGEDHFTSRVGVGGLLNMEKIDLVQSIVDNLDTFHKHHRQERELAAHRQKSEDSNQSTYKCSNQPQTHTVVGVAPHGVSLIPLHLVDNDLIQKLQHGCTVIHYDVESARSVLCHLRMDPSSGVVLWQKHNWSTWIGGSAKNSLVGNVVITSDLLRGAAPSSGMGQPQSALVGGGINENLSSRWISKFVAGDISWKGLDEGYLELNYVKNIEACDSWDLDVEAIYRRHSMEEMSVPVQCWTIVYGDSLSENESLYFLSPQCIAETWKSGLQQVVKELRKQASSADRRMMWLKKLYLDLYYENEMCTGPSPASAIQAFGGKAFWKEHTSSFGQNQDVNTSNFKKVGTLSLTTSVLRKKKPTQVTYANIPKESEHEKNQLSTPGDHRSSLKSRRSTTSTVTTSSPSPIPSAHSLLKPVDSDELSLRSRASTLSQQEREREKDVQSTSSEYQERHMSFVEFIELYKAFSLRMRKDLRNLFNDVCAKQKEKLTHRESKTTTIGYGLVTAGSYSSVEKEDGSPSEEILATAPYEIDVLTRNSAQSFKLSEKQHKIYNALATASLSQNSAGVDTSRSAWLTVSGLKGFMLGQQMEAVDDDDVVKIIRTHEPDPFMRCKNRMSFEGFARYLLDRTNFAFASEETKINEQEMNYPLSYYYIASSHNTYLTGHQLKGDSSVELYRQVLLTGCRCIEFDCWDGDDGLPVIYHGHTFTSKISFRQVVDVVKKSAFIKSVLPVIISIENHCSLMQQTKMAQTFKTVFGDALVSSFMFDADYSDSPRLPTPWQLRNKFLIKNKKLVFEPLPSLIDRTNRPSQSETTLSRKASRNSVNSSTGDDEDDDIEDELDDVPDDIDEGVDHGTPAARKSDKTQQSVSPNDTPKSLRRSFDKEDRNQKLDRKVPFLSSVGKQDSLSSETSAGGKCEQPLRAKSDSEHAIDSAADEPGSGHGGKRPVQGGPVIAAELSELVIYCQAVKFKGFPTSLASSYVEKKPTQISQPPRRMTTSTLAPSFLPTIERDGDSSSDKSPSVISARRTQPRASCFQVASLNETAAKKLCRKHPLKLIAYSKDHIVRTYPAGMRIDSSNFNPLMFWTLGLQMVALNYQTPDFPMHLNTAMFEYNGNCGYALKPRVMWDSTHPLYNRFSPWNREISGISAVYLTLSVISGQHVCPLASTASPLVEIEIIGIPTDCCKEKTKVVQRNGVNPIWNQTFNFRINFLDLAFVRVSVFESNSNKCTAQRVVPLRHLKAGYRHLRLRNMQNSSIDCATLFMHSRLEEEEFIYVDDDVALMNSSGAQNCEGVPILKKQIYIVKIYGLYPDDSPITVKVQNNTTVKETITMTVSNLLRQGESIDDYMLIEEMVNSPNSSDAEAGGSCVNGSNSPMSNMPNTQRILSSDDLIMNAVAHWNGAKGRFVVRKKGSDPSSRAWITTIIKSGKEKKTTEAKAWLEHGEATFLVCVHNVSEDQPYAILRAPLNSTSQDIVCQVLLKARRMDNPLDFALVEETAVQESLPQTNVGKSSFFGGPAKPSKQATVRRVLQETDLIYPVQTNWKTTGRFLLERKQIVHEKEKEPAKHKRKPLTQMKSLNFPKFWNKSS